MILGKFVKQPLERESYSIQFKQDLSETDEGIACWVMVYDKDAIEGPIVLNSELTVSQSGQAYYTNNNITLPNAPDGFMVAVSNINQTLPLQIVSDGINGDMSFELASRQGVYLVRSGGQWVIEASVRSVLVAMPDDQRVRTYVSGGKVDSTYKIEVTLATQEDRVLQNEFIIKIKDS